MKKRLRFLGSRLLSALRLALGALLFTPVFALLVAVNYGVDCQGYFLGDTYLREIATMLFEGKNVVGFNQLNGRELEVLEVIVANMNEETTPETIALGSSRILQLTREMVGTSFYNSGTSGGDFNDVLSVFSLYDKAGKLPKNVIIGLDPWLFNTDVDANGSNDPSLYAEFLTEKLGVPTEYEKKDLSKTWKNLFDLTYFQGNIEYMLKGSNKSGAAQTVDDSALYQQDTEVKCSDGSLVYDREFRGWKQDAVDHAALEVANNGMFRLDYYTEPDAQRLAIFEKWLQYMQEKGINVIILLSPYTPLSTTAPYRTPSVTAACSAPRKPRARLEKNTISPCTAAIILMPFPPHQPIFTTACTLTATAWPASFPAFPRLWPTVTRAWM